MDDGRPAGLFPLHAVNGVSIDQTNRDKKRYSGQWAVGSGQWAVGSGQWAVGSGQGLADDRRPTTVDEGRRTKDEGRLRATY
jgi:hypothetical protein